MDESRGERRALLGLELLVGGAGLGVALMGVAVLLATMAELRCSCGGG